MVKTNSDMRALTVQLCTLLGVDPDRARKVTLVLEANAVPTLTIERYVYAEADITSLVDAAKAYQAVEQTETVEGKLTLKG